MKTLLLLLLPLFASSQGVVGLTYAELTAAFPGTHFTKVPAHEGVVFYAEYECAKFGYYVQNGDNRILFSMNFPDNLGCVNAFVEKYNNKYVIVSNIIEINVIAITFFFHAPLPIWLIPLDSLERLFLLAHKYRSAK